MNLRAVLDAVRTADADAGLDDIARDLGLRRDEVDAAVEYWAHRGELLVAEIGGCPPAGCTGCHFHSDGCARPPKLFTITSRAGTAAGPPRPSPRTAHPGPPPGG